MKLQIAANTFPALPLLIHLQNTLALPKVAAIGIDGIVDSDGSNFRQRLQMTDDKLGAGEGDRFPRLQSRLRHRQICRLSLSRGMSRDSAGLHDDEGLLTVPI